MPRHAPAPILHQPHSFPTDRRELYEHEPPSRPGAPQGSVHTFRHDDSTVYIDTKRAFHVRAPNGFDGEPVGLMIFLC